MVRNLRTLATAAALFALLTGGAALAQDQMSGGHMQDTMHAGTKGDRMHASKMSSPRSGAQAAMNHAMVRMSAADRRTMRRAMVKLTPHERFVMMKAMTMARARGGAMERHSKMARPAKMSSGSTAAHPHKM